MTLAPLRKTRRAALRVDLRAAHLSGRFDRDPDDLRDELERVERWADIITLTEVDRNARGDVLERFAREHGFQLLRRGNGTKGESAILVHTSVWRVRRWAAVMLAGDLDGMRGGQVAVLALLEHVETRATLLVSTTHTSSGVEGDWARGRRATEHRTAVQTWRRVVREWRRKHRPDAELIVADWNLDAHKPWVRAWIRSAWPGLLLPRQLPKQGSHGGRLIDWCLTRRIRRVQLIVMRLTDASDHRGVRITGTIRPRKEHRP